MRDDYIHRFRNRFQDLDGPFEHESPEFSPPPPPHPQNPKRQRKKERRLELAGPDSSYIDIETSTDVKEEVKFCSRSEAICAEILKRFVPHFELQEGVTFQVPIGRDARGNTLCVDFLVDGVLFEYHPVRFFKNKKGCGDFRDPEEYRSYTRVFHALNQDKRGFFHDVMKARLTENYFKRRRAVLDRHPLYRRTELIVATSPEEFYNLVIRRFGRSYPKNIEKFMALFEQLQKTLPEGAP